MPLSPGTSELVTIGGSGAAPNTPRGKIFSTTNTIKSITMNPLGPLEAGRTVQPSTGIRLKAAAGTSIPGNTTAP